MSNHLALLGACLLTLALLCPACASDDAAESGDASSSAARDLSLDRADRSLPRARNDNLSNAGLSRLTYDLNDDSKPDQIHLSNASGLVRIERDFNFDGRFDSFEHYDRGRLTEEEMDLDLDGHIDVVRYYATPDTIDHKLYALGFDQRMTIARWYDEAGDLVRIERDTDHDARVDTWEHYAPGSSTPVRVENDDNGDGQPDPVAVPAGAPVGPVADDLGDDDLGDDDLGDDDLDDADLDDDLDDADMDDI